MVCPCWISSRTGNRPHVRAAAPGTFPQVILTRTPTFHGLASNAVTNESAKTPPSAVARKCSNPNTVVARAGGVWKAPAHAQLGYAALLKGTLAQKYNCQLVRRSGTPVGRA